MSTNKSAKHARRIATGDHSARKDDFFILLDHPDAKFDYAPHWHTDFELNIVMDSCGERVVGDSHEDFDALDVVLIGPRLPHIWKGEVERATMW